jgi:hypothetical protein
MLYCVQEAEAIVIADDDGDASPVKRSKQPQRTKRRVLEDDDEDAQEEEGKARARVCPKKEEKTKRRVLEDDDDDEEVGAVVKKTQDSPSWVQVLC